MECGSVEADAKVSNARIPIPHAAIEKEISYSLKTNFEDADIVSYPQINRHQCLHETYIAVFPVT